jgi:imidazolonepropionase-like amidohydrolase
MVREGVDTLKINVSGDAGTPASPADTTVMNDAEVAAVCDVAQAHRKRVAAHARSAESVKMCLRHGVDVIYHATLLDDEARDQLEAQRDRVFVAPVLGNLYATLNEAAQWGITREMAEERGIAHEIEEGIGNMKALHKRGVRVLIGGDYGFAWNPIGTDARDIGHFVDMLGFSPMDAILAATRLGGEIMGMGDRLGQVRPGYLADLLLVDGDPLEDVAILQQRDRFKAIMKDGAFWKSPERGIVQARS